MLKKISFGLVAFGFATQVMAAPLTMGQIYNYARKGDMQSLKKVAKHIDSVGKDGNTNLCRAVYRNDYKAFNALKAAGASVQHACVKKIPAEKIKAFNEGYANWAKGMNASAKIATGTTTAGTVETETGLSTGAKIGIGVGAVALIGGGIALAAGGGGGGGSSAPVCSGHGTKDAEGLCVCDTGYAGDSCETCNTGFINQGGICYAALDCVNGTQNKDKCDCRNGWNGTLCETANACEGYETSCPVGYAQSATCQRGDDTVYQCNNCASGYIKLNGVCVEEMDCNHGTQSGDRTCDCNQGWGGDVCNTCDTGYDHYDDPNGCYLPMSCGTNKHQEANRCVCDAGYPVEYNGECYAQLTCGMNEVQQGDTCVCKDGYEDKGNGCEQVINCSANQYFDGTSCQSCQNGGTSIGGTATSCSCSGNWTGTDCGSCTLIGNVNTDTCSCNSGTTLRDGVCVSSDLAGGNGHNWAKLSSGVKVLWEDKSLDSNNSYTNSTDIHITDFSDLPNGDILGNMTSFPKSYNENNFEMLWLVNHLYKNLGDGYWDDDDDYDDGYSGETIYKKPLLYAADPGASGGKITLKNTANISTASKFEYDSNYNYTDYDLTEVFIYGANFENDGNIGTDYETATVEGYSVGAPIAVSNNGIINGDVDLWGLDGKITFVNINHIDNVNLYGNVSASNAGTIERLYMDGSAILENEGRITEGIELYKGTILNHKDGIISGDYDEYDDEYDTAITVWGPSKLVNEGTINGNIVIMKHLFMPTGVNMSDYSIIYTDLGETRAYLDFLNTGTFNGNRIEIKTLDDMLSNSSINLVNSGLINGKDYLDLNQFVGQNGKITLLNGGSLLADKIKGNLHVKGDINGFGKEYVLSNAIQSSDTTGLNLVSESALFNASLAENGKDVIMTMKGFDTATDNKSLSDFLTHNYAMGNNEAFFNKLKGFGDVGSLTAGLNSLTGQDMLSRFNFEDMTMMRELNFDMNDKLFHNKEQSFSLAGSVSPMAFKGDTGSNARYSLFNKRQGKFSLGLGVAFTDVRSDDDHNDNARSETMYQLVVPMGYKTHGFNLVTSPRLGYARGSYDRTGFEGKSYDGTIEKRVFGLMNEARYPMTFGDWSVEPSAEFNVIGYQQKGSEDAKEYSLNIKSQKTYSVEGGFGLYLNKVKELAKDKTLKLNLGASVYHEFADPYQLEVGLTGMDGSFMLRDEERSDNRAVIRAGFDYAEEDYSIYGSFISYIDREVRTALKSGFKWKF